MKYKNMSFWQKQKFISFREKLWKEIKDCLYNPYWGRNCALKYTEFLDYMHHHPIEKTDDFYEVVFDGVVDHKFRETTHFFGKVADSIPKEKKEKLIELWHKYDRLGREPIQNSSPFSPQYLYEKAREKAKKAEGEKASFLELSLGDAFGDAEKKVKQHQKDGVLGSQTMVFLGESFKGPYFKLVGDDFELGLIIGMSEYDGKLQEISILTQKGLKDPKKLVDFLDEKYGTHLNTQDLHKTKTYHWFKGTSEVRLVHLEPNDLIDEATQKIIFSDIALCDKEKEEREKEKADRIAAEKAKKDKEKKVSRDAFK